MAEKLTPHQKALNKEAARRRDRAFRERKTAYEAELSAARAAVEASDIAVEAQRADEAMAQALSVRHAEELEIEKQIEALTQKLQQVRKTHQTRIDELNQARKSTWAARHAARSAAEASVAARYPDVADCWSAAAWKPFEEFLDVAEGNVPG